MPSVWMINSQASPVHGIDVASGMTAPPDDHLTGTNFVAADVRQQERGRGSKREIRLQL